MKRGGFETCRSGCANIADVIILTENDPWEELGVNMSTDHEQAWNNFALNSDPYSPEIDQIKRYAAIANLYMAGANNGGINSFLTAAPLLSGQEVVDALVGLGATSAAEQLIAVLNGLGEAILRSSAESRWETLDRLWTYDLDELDVLSEETNAEMLRVLERHVNSHVVYYQMLGVDAANHS